MKERETQKTLEYRLKCWLWFLDMAKTQKFSGTPPDGSQPDALKRAPGPHP